MNTLPKDLSMIIVEYTSQLKREDVLNELKTVCFECKKVHLDKKTYSCESCESTFCGVKKIQPFFCPPYYSGSCPHCDDFIFVFHEDYTEEDYRLPERR